MAKKNFKGFGICIVLEVQKSVPNREGCCCCFKSVQAVMKDLGAWRIWHELIESCHGAMRVSYKDPGCSCREDGRLCNYEGKA
jgi:hypothetical protein